MRIKIIPLFLLLTCVAMAQSNIERQKDSLRNDILLTQGEDKLRTYRRLTNIYYVESAQDALKMDTLLTLYDQMIAQARQQNNVVFQGVAMANTLGALNNSRLFDEVFKRAPEYIDFLQKNEGWTFYYPSCKYLIEAYLLSNQYEKAIEEATKMYQKAQEQENNAGVGQALYMMSNAYRDMRRNDEAERCMRQSIDLLKNERGMLPIVADGYAHLCYLLLFEERYQEVFEEAKEFEKVIGLFEADSRMAQPTAWANLYHVLAKAYVGTGDFNNAERYCNQAESMYKGVINEIEKADIWAQIYEGRKEYEKALAMLDRAIMLNEERQDTDAKVKIPQKKSAILAKMGRYQEAYTLSGHIFAANDSIRNTVFNAQLDELRTLYEVDKLEKENQIITIEKRRNRNYFIFASMGCALLIITLSIWIFYSRSIVRKNRGLYRQIREQDFLAEVLERERSKNLKLQEQLKCFSAPFTQKEEEDEIFGRLSLLMKEQRLYIEGEIKRDDIAERIGINGRRLHDCIKEHTGMSFTEYINSLRLSYSRELLAQKGDKLTIDAIAIDAGFNSRTTFYRLFREKYGLSPDEFRTLTK
jgi:AraC-like DNA-binding protein